MADAAILDFVVTSLPISDMYTTYALNLLKVDQIAMCRNDTNGGRILNFVDASIICMLEIFMLEIILL